MSSILSFGLILGVRATALFLLAGVAHVLLGRRRALARSALWNACLLGLVALPVAALALPRLPIPLLSAAPPVQAGPLVDAGAPNALDHGPLVAKFPKGTRSDRSTQSDRLASAIQIDSPAAPAPSRTRLLAASTASSVAPRYRTLVTLTGVVAGFYVAGVALLLSRLVRSLIAIRTLARYSEPVVAASWIEARENWARFLRLDRPVRLSCSARVIVPAVFGHFRPLILLPNSLVGSATPALIDAVVLHELSHARRGDFAWNLLRMLVQALYWPHPLAWMLGPLIGQEREQACDDLCVHGLGGSTVYRDALIEVASRLVHRADPSLALSMARSSTLAQRLAWIDQSPGTPVCLIGQPLRVLLAILVLALTGLFGAGELSAASSARSVASIELQPETPPQQQSGPPSPAPATTMPTLASLITALQTEEARYRDIEYSFERTTRRTDPKKPEAPGEVQSREARHVVLQGGLIAFRSDSTSRDFAKDRRKQEVSVYDGERTRSVIVGESVNIHIGRFEHPDIYPAHSLPFLHYHLNFPLSVYLSGAAAIQANPKYGRFAKEGGSVYEFTKVEARVEGEEVVDGLRCLKVRVNRWYYSTDVPVLQYLWLAADRNYVCIKEQLSWPRSMFGDQILHEMTAGNLQEIAPGCWLPLKITTLQFARDKQDPKRPIVSSREETIIDQASLHPHHDAAYFHDVEIPADLPAFTIRDRTLEGSTLPQPIADEAEEKRKLDEVVARVRQEEQRYANLEVKSHVDYKYEGDSMLRSGIITEEARTAHSVVRGPMSYYAMDSTTDTFGGRGSVQHEVSACDGQWTRTLYRVSLDEQPDQIIAILRKGAASAEGRNDGLAVLRPHTFLLRDDSLYGPLADLLVSPWYDRVNNYRLRFRYCGEELVDGHPCVKLRGDTTTREGQPPSGFMALWLATDRNFIPIKYESYGNNPGLSTLPGGLSRCDDFRQIAEGVWYPYRTMQMQFKDMAWSRITVSWRRVYEVDSVALDPEADSALFRGGVLPAGTKVQVSDEHGEFLGEYVQEAEGVAEVSPTRYLKLVSEAKVRDEEQQARQRAMDALLGKPAPEFPTGATWLQGEPLTWAALRGKVVILDFWAEWCAPCRGDFPQLALLHDARNANGLTIIGVHPPGSEPKAIQEILDEFHLSYPICVDTPAGEGVQAWGSMFDQFAIRAIPHAVAVDAQGTVIASGRLQEVLTRALELRKKP